MRRALALLLALATTPAAAVDARMEPFKMVRSLQLVQDRLARGDHAALPMQQKLLQLTDERFRVATDADFSDPRNVPALLVYAMSGGNPTTLQVATARLPADDAYRDLAKGVLAYMTGELVKASELLAPFDPMTQREDVGAYLALVKGSILVGKQPGAALGLMDQARLLAPGTLVEEAALRRSLSACINLDQAERFMRMAEQYTRRFLRSPYASEFADAFVDGLVVFHDRITPDQIRLIVELMRPAQQEAIYLRLARRSTIKGHAERSAFASEMARKVALGAETEEDPRANFYAALSSITSDNFRDVLKTLDGVDVTYLSPRDRRLLMAARAIAAEMLAPPAAVEPETTPAAAQGPEEEAMPASARAADTIAAPAAAESHEEPASPVEGDAPAAPVAAAAEADESAVPAPAHHAGGSPSMAAGDDMAPSSELVLSVREKLEAIDRLLEEQPR